MLLGDCKMTTVTTTGVMCCGKPYMYYASVSN